MPDFSDFEDDAKKLASDHPDQADQAIDKAGQFADQETGNRFDSEIQQGEKEGDNYLGGQGQDQSQQQPGQQQPGQQQPGQQQQSQQQQSQDQGQYGGDQGQGGQY
jgi:hypothetical protein